MKLHSASWLAASLFLLSVILSSCSADPAARKLRYFQSGQRYFEKGRYEEAAIEFINAVKIDPAYAEAHQQLAETYLRLNKPQGALQEIGRTIQLQPHNYKAHLELANLLILSHSLPEAKDEIDALLQERPQDSTVHSANANLMAAQGDIRGAIAEMQKTIALEPGRWQFYLSLAMLQAKSDQPDAAEASLLKVIELNSKASQARLLLGSYYQSRTRYSDAEREFQEAAAVDAKSVDPRTALVRLYLLEGKTADALESARDAKRDFPNDHAASCMLANVYAATGNMDEALAEYVAIMQQHPKDLQIKKDYIQLLLEMGRIGEPSQIDAELLKANPNDRDGLIYRSQIQISSGHASDATKTLETLIENDPGNSEAHYVLGVGYDKLGNPKRAESEWREALRLRPDLLDATKELARAAMNRNDMDALDQEATEMVRLQPGSPEGYGLRALANLNRKRFSAAEVDVRKAIEVAPQSSFGYVQLGNLKLAQKQFADAGNAYQSALDRNPNSKDALRGLMSTYIAQKKVDQAILAANAQITKAPNNSGFYELLGTALFINKKDLNGAEAAFEKSAQVDSKNFSAQLRLAQVQVAKGNIEYAIATCKRALENNPNEFGMLIMLGDLYRSQQSWNRATESYQKALTIRPENPLASSDLAYVMLQSGGNLDVALSLAQSARRAVPDSPSIADTVGWIYYQKGAYRLAVDSLREAVRLGENANSPDNPTFHYHLGMAYAKSGEITLARQQFQQVLRMNPNSGEAGDAKKQLAGLNS